MGDSVWLVLALVTAHLYEWRARAEFERISLRVALLAMLIVAVLAYAIYRFEIPVTMLSGAFLGFTGCMLGTWYWSRSPIWKWCSGLLSATLVTLFYVRPACIDLAILNNILLLAVAVGIAYYLAHRLSRSFVCVLFLALCVFDVYAVWCTDTMLHLIERTPKAFPGGFLVMAMAPVPDLLGAGDVIFAATSVLAIRIHAGLRWSLAATACYALSLWLLAFGVFLNVLPAKWCIYWTLFPVMVVIGPVTIGCLLLGESSRSPACS